MNKVKGVVESYIATPNEAIYRSGRNLNIWSDHYIKVDGLIYYVEAQGTRHWAYKGDTVYFEWALGERATRDGEYKTAKLIIPETFRAWNKNGIEVLRGIRERNKPRRQR